MSTPCWQHRSALCIGPLLDSPWLPAMPAPSSKPLPKLDRQWRRIMRRLLADLISLLQRIALVQIVPKAVDDTWVDAEAVCRLAVALGPEDVQLLYQIALLGRPRSPAVAEPRGGFEMVLLRMLCFVR